MRGRPSGPTSSSIAIVGEAPGGEEEKEGLPFVGPSGYELTKMLTDAKIVREACFITNVTHDRPPNNEIAQWISTRKTAPDSSYIHYRGRWVKPFIKEECERLYSEIRAVQPNVIIAFGNTPLYALCSERGITKWRGSILLSDAIPNLKVIPALHPADILRVYKDRAITVQDLRRAKRESTSPIVTKPSYGFLTRPSIVECRAFLHGLIHSLERSRVPFTCDLEIYRREILCVGLATSRTEAICIPFLHTKGHYWPQEQALELIWLLRKVLCHPNAQLINQNLSFDVQYLFWRFFIRPKMYFDTMLAQNVLFSGLPKDLAYLASMYCDHYVYWKDDGKFWENFNDEELWHYNCLDCVYTFEVWEKQRDLLIASGLHEQMAFQMKTLENCMDLMIKGVRVDLGNKVALLGEIQSLIARLHEEVAYLTQSNLRGDKGDLSSDKIMDLFYRRLALPVIYKATKKDGKRKSSPTCDDEALKKIASKNAYLRPLIERINMIRSYGTAEDVCRKRVDKDHRWRTSYNVAGTTSYRLASSENPLDSGLNLQNLTTGKDINE